MRHSKVQWLVEYRYGHVESEPSAFENVDCDRMGVESNVEAIREPWSAGLPTKGHREAGIIEPLRSRHFPRHIHFHSIRFFRKPLPQIGDSSLGILIDYGPIEYSCL